MDGRKARLPDGRILLDWSQRPVLHHREGCVLCCLASVARHPKNCPNCGPAYTGRRPDICVLCRRSTAHFRDDAGKPVHKVCVEEATAARAGRREPS